MKHKIGQYIAPCNKPSTTISDNPLLVSELLPGTTQTSNLSQVIYTLSMLFKNELLTFNTAITVNFSHTLIIVYKYYILLFKIMINIGLSICINIDKLSARH